MAIAHAIEVFGARGNMDAVADLEKVLQKHGDVNGERAISLATPEQLTQRESKAWGQDIFPPPQVLFDVWESLVRRGITIFEPHAVVIDGDALYWGLFEKTPKPNFTDGKQAYENDPLNGILTDLRKGKKIAGYKRGDDSIVPNESRFGISATELTGSVMPEIKRRFSINKGNLRLWSMHEYTKVGGLFYPELGETNTGEWLQDETKAKDQWMPHRNVAGNSESGGLTDIWYEWVEFRSERIGFRLMIEFSA